MNNNEYEKKLGIVIVVEGVAEEVFMFEKNNERQYFIDGFFYAGLCGYGPMSSLVLFVPEEISKDHIKKEYDYIFDDLMRTLPPILRQAKLNTLANKLEGKHV